MHLTLILTLTRFFNNLLEPAQKLTKSLNIPLHPVGTVLFHTFRNMTIDIQREGRCRMPQISLHRFDIISVLERQDGVGMTKIMHPGVGSADRYRQLLEVIVYGLGMQMSAELIGEYKSGPPLFFIFLPLPFRAAL